jgi:hypothetical protein
MRPYTHDFYHDNCDFHHNLIILVIFITRVSGLQDDMMGHLMDKEALLLVHILFSTLPL